MGTTERDSTEDWILPAAARPPSMQELEQRVDVALAVARSAEAAALEIGDAAFEAAEQARRAAEFAERAVSGEPDPLPLALPADVGAEAEPAANGAEGEDGFAVEVVASGVEAPVEQDGVEDQDERLRVFSERADRVMTRLRALEPA